jgi:signal transduction histidine kinase
VRRDSILSLGPVPLPGAPPSRYRVVAVWVAAAALLACGVVLLGVDREIDAQMSDALVNQRIHIEKVTAIRRSARSAYVLLLERWLRPLPERGARERAVEQAVDSIRDQIDSFAATSPIGPDEAQARTHLITAVAMWSNRVQQSVVASDGPAATAELRALLDAIDVTSDRVQAIDSTAGASTDARVARLHARQASIQLAFVGVAIGILALALAWWRGKQRAERRFRASERARTEQEHGEKLRTQFFANTSHELRTPLVAIRGFAALISDRPDPGGQVREAALKIDREAADLLGQIDNILDAAKLARGAVDLQVGDVDVGGLIRRCVQRCTPLLTGKSLELDVEMTPGLPHVQSDAVKLQHVLTNLVANAIKFTDKGRVTIRARASDSGRLVLEVEDTGIGIADHALSRIWNPFEQADVGISRKFGGTGLGLSIVRALTDRLGGEVTVDSTVGKGTTFRVALPATPPGGAHA